MEENSLDINLVRLYIPLISDEELSTNVALTESFEIRFDITKSDFAEITDTHARVFERLIQLDSTRRRKPAPTLDGFVPEPLVTVLARLSKAETKERLARIHLLLDRYQVPRTDRKSFFKALTVCWYYVYSMHQADREAAATKPSQ